MFKGIWKKPSPTVEKQIGEWTLIHHKPDAVEVAGVANLLAERLIKRVAGLGFIKDIRVIVRDRKADAKAIDPLMAKEVGIKGWSIGVKITVDMLAEAADLRLDGELQEGVKPEETEI